MGSFVTLTPRSLKLLLEACHNCSKGKEAEVSLGNTSQSVGKDTGHFFSFLCCETVISIEGVTWHSEHTGITSEGVTWHAEHTAALGDTAGKPQPHPEETHGQDDANTEKEVVEFIEIGVKSEDGIKSIRNEDDASCKIMLEKDPLLLEETSAPSIDRGKCESEEQTQQQCEVESVNKSLRKNMVGILGRQDLLGVNVSMGSNKFPGSTTGKKYPDTFSCEFCGKIFVGKDRAYQFYYHRNREHTREMTFKCDLCSKVFWGDRELLAHRTQHKDQGHVCHICGRKFRAEKNLQVHFLVHSSTREHVCRFCDKAFKRKDHLTVHERIHTGGRPYQCQWCDSGYPQKHQLKLHMRKCPILKQTEAKLCAS